MENITSKLVFAIISLTKHHWLKISSIKNAGHKILYNNDSNYFSCTTKAHKPNVTLRTLYFLEVYLYPTIYNLLPGDARVYINADLSDDIDTDENDDQNDSDIDNRLTNFLFYIG